MKSWHDNCSWSEPWAPPLQQPVWKQSNILNSADSMHGSQWTVFVMDLQFATFGPLIAQIHFPLQGPSMLITGSMTIVWWQSVQQFVWIVLRARMWAERPAPFLLQCDQLMALWQHCDSKRSDQIERQQLECSWHWDNATQQCCDIDSVALKKIKLWLRSLNTKERRSISARMQKQKTRRWKQLSSPPPQRPRMQEASVWECKKVVVATHENARSIRMRMRT